MSRVTAKGIAQFEANKNKGWSWDEWQENAPEGIEAMEETNPNMFNNLYMQEFGVDPSSRLGSRQLHPDNSVRGKAKFEANFNKGWTWDEWQENAPEAIAYMESHKPDFFNTLYQIEFGVTPKPGTPNAIQLSSKDISVGKTKFEANANKGWSWDEWQENAPEAIEYMETGNPNLFKSLYNAAFGVIPNLGVQFQNNLPVAVSNTQKNETNGVDKPQIGKWYTTGDPTPYNTESEATAAGLRLKNSRQNNL